MLIIKSRSNQGSSAHLIGKIRNIFAVDVGRYTQNATNQRSAFNKAKVIWDKAAQELLAA